MKKSFNSRTREGCDSTIVVTLKDITVSIHAPARGAIAASSAKEATESFNSRTREGCDGGLTLGKWIIKFQFTHPRGVR